MEYNDEIIFTTVSVDNKSRKKNYIDKTIKLVESVLNHSKFKVIVVTNKPENFKIYDTNEQVIIKDTFEKNINIVVPKTNYFNMHLKRHAIHFAINTKNKYIIYLDGDAYLTNQWDDSKNLELFNNIDFDFIGNKIYSVSGLNQNAEQKGEIFWWKKVMGDLWDDNLFEKCYAPQETHLLFKNNEKLKLFDEFWLEIEKRTYELGLKTTHIGYPIGCSICKSNMLNGFNKKNKDLIEYFNGFKLNHLDKETKIISGI